MVFESGQMTLAQDFAEEFADGAWLIEESVAQALAQTAPPPPTRPPPGLEQLEAFDPAVEAEFATSARRRALDPALCQLVKIPTPIELARSLGDGSALYFADPEVLSSARSDGWHWIGVVFGEVARTETKEARHTC